MKIHPVAELFPMLPASELDEMAASIRKDGLINPCVMQDDVLIDGRNRMAACKLASVEPRFIQYHGESPVAFIIAANLQRRHLDKGQKIALALEIEPHFAEEAKKRQRGGQGGVLLVEKVPQAKSRDQAAAAVGVSGKLVSAAKAIRKADPDKFKQVISGEISVAEASREIKRAELTASLNSVSALEAKKVEGVYDVIVIDPPWPMQKIERDVAPNQVAFEYPVMSLDEIGEVKIPAAKDAHIWLWTTHKFLPTAFELLDRWGVKYVCCFTWHKNGGFQAFGLPQYNSEFCLYGRIGSPKFIDTKAFMTCFKADRGAHSEKPEVFYDVIRRVTAGRRLDMYNRRKISGYDGWGKEAK